MTMEIHRGIESQVVTSLPSRWPTLLTRTAAAAILAAGTLGAANAPAVAAAPAIPGLTDSSKLSTPIIADGNVSDAVGGLSAGSQVVLMAIPDLSPMKPGDSVALQPVAFTSTDKTGRFALRLQDASSLASFTDKDGILNFEIVATNASGDQTSAYTFSRGLARNATGSVSVTTSEAAAASTKASPLTSATKAAPAAQPPSVSLQLSRGATAQTDSSATGVAKIGCGQGLVFDHYQGHFTDIVGQTYANTKGVHHKFTYTSGATSELGVALTVNADPANWSSGGSQAITSSASEIYPEMGELQGWYYKSDMEYGAYRYINSCAGNVTLHWESRPVYFWGGATYSAAGYPSTPYCATYQTGTEYVGSQGAAITWSNGLSMKTLLGIDLSSKTGYSTLAETWYHFYATHRLCGSNTAPANYPYITQALT